MKQLLRHGNGCLKIEYDESQSKLTVKVDRSKILPYGKNALAEMLLKIHIYRCTADVAAGRPYFEDLTNLEPEHERWRAIVLKNPPPRMKFVQADTFLDGDEVTVKAYDATDEGMIQSWAERGV